MITRRRRGLTLMELTIVLGVLAALAAIVAVSTAGVLDESRERITMASMREVQKVILNRYRLDMGGKITTVSTLEELVIATGFPGPDANDLESGREVHPQLHFLFTRPSNSVAFNPLTGKGWRGPYLTPTSVRYPNPAGEAGTVRGFTEQFGKEGDFAIFDAWNNPLVIQVESITELYLVSAGPDRKLNTAADNLSIPLH